MTDQRFRAFLEAVGNIHEIRDGLVTVSFSPTAGGAELDSIWSEIERRKGHASRAMSAILALADEHGIDVYAQPHWLAYDVERYTPGEDFPSDELDRMDRLNEQRLDNQQLLGWYERLGFEYTGRRRADDPELVRRSRVPMPRP